jgi:Mce-associated membrane protein
VTAAGGLLRAPLRRSLRDGAGAPPQDTASTSGSSGVPTWLLAGLGVLAAGLVVATAWTWTQGAAAGDDSAARAAQVAAERAVVPVLSYDYESLEADQREAQALMTGGYREEYDKLFTVLEDNAPQTQTKVSASVVASGVVRASDDRVQVLVFVDRPTTNKLNAEPVVYKDQVTVSMQRVDGSWLVDDLITSPTPG